jgi:hypothetical protein
LNQKAGKQRGAIYAVAPGFHNVNTIWAGTDDGQVWRTKDAGKNWKNITPRELTDWSKVTQISASHFDDDTAYVSVSRFRIDDLRPYIYRTHNGGKTWHEITTGLPTDSPVNAVREDPVRKGLLFAGTETEVWVSFDDGDHWQSLQLNLPHTSMRDLWIHNDDLIVGTHGRSFWILDDISPLRQITAGVANSTNAAHLFTPATAYRVRRDTNTDTPLPADEPAGKNPPDGALIDYTLPPSVQGSVTLEILDAQGKLVRQYSSTDKPELTQAELQQQLIPLYWLRPQRILSAESGMHRWVWDLRYAPPNSTTHQYPISAVPHDTPRYPLGPLVLPGKYQARLTAAGHTDTHEFEVKMDPRVKASPTDLQQQFEAETKLVALVNESSESVTQARTVHEQIAKLLDKAPGSLKDSLGILEHKISELLDSDNEADSGKVSTLPTINTNLMTLYGEIGKADAAPTVVQVDAVNKNEAALDTIRIRWNQLKSHDISALNHDLKNAGLPELRLDLPPQQQEGGEDEE